MCLWSIQWTDHKAAQNLLQPDGSDAILRLFLRHPMNATAHPIKEFFTDSEWDLIYNFIGNALDDDEFDPEEVYSIRNKIHSIFAED